MLICFVCVIAGALLMRYLIEKPALWVRNRVLARLKHVSQAKRAVGRAIPSYGEGQGGV